MNSALLLMFPLAIVGYRGLPACDASRCEAPTESSGPTDAYILLSELQPLAASAIGPPSIGYRLG